MVVKEEVLSVQDAVLTEKKVKLFTREEVAKHNKEDDVWLIVEQGVYDCTEFMAKHPGGKIILHYAGMDATDVFVAMHPKWANRLLPKYKVGELKDSATPKLVQEYRSLRNELTRMGMFRSNKMYFLRLMTINWVLFVTSWVLLFMFPDNIYSTLAAAFSMALFWQQNGWLSHDFLHYSVYNTRAKNWIIPYVMGGMMSGYSFNWWNTKHNAHHAVPNVLSGDPDIDTHPILTWSEKDSKVKIETLGFAKRLWLKYQAYGLIPLLLFARISWTIQSLIMLGTPNEWRKLEIPALSFYWVWSLTLPFLFSSPFYAITFWVVSQFISGWLLAGVFLLNHSGMEIFEENTQANLDFFRMQIFSSRDVTPNWFVNWITGGLNFQTVHHLYPRMPRHNYPAVQSILREFCQKHGIHYHVTTVSSGAWEVLSSLHRVSFSLKFDILE